MGGDMIGRWNKEADTRCPNCKRLGEMAERINRCPDPGRTRHFLVSVDRVKQWLITHNTHPQLVEIIPRYLLGRGRVKMADVCCMSTNMWKAAAAQDRVGWRHFTEVKFVQHLLLAQEGFLVG